MIGPGLATAAAADFTGWRLIGLCVLADMIAHGAVSACPTEAISARWIVSACRRLVDWTRLHADAYAAGDMVTFEAAVASLGRVEHDLRRYSGNVLGVGRRRFGNEQ